MSLSNHSILGINFSKLYFRFTYDLLQWESFLLMNELHNCTNLQVRQVHNKFSCIISREILKQIFLNSSIKSFNHTRFFFVSVEQSSTSFLTSLLQNSRPLSTQILLGLRSFKILENAFATSCPVLCFKGIKICQLRLTSILFHYCLLKMPAYLLIHQPKFH